MSGPSAGSGRRIKVAIIGSFPNPGNPAKAPFTAQISRSISTFADTINIFPRWMTPKRLGLNRYEFGGLEVIEAPFPSLPNDLTWSVALGARLTRPRMSRLLRDCDVVHAVYGVPLGPLSHQWMRGSSAKLVVTTLGGDINVHFPKIHDQFGVRGWENSCSAMLGVSQALTDAASRIYPGIPIQEVVYLGVDLSRFSQAPARTGPLTFLFLGGFPNYQAPHPHGRNTKGGVTLMEAWRKIEGRLPEGTRLIVGGPDAQGEFARGLMGGLAHPERMETLGTLPDSEMPGLFARADVVLLPSMTEGLPTVAMETGATGRAMIASRVGGVPEVIEDGATGRILPPADVEAWSEAILDAAARPDEHREMGERARRRMEERFDQRRLAGSLRSVYERVLGRSLD